MIVCQLIQLKRISNYHIQQSRGEPFQHTETGNGVVHHYQGTDAEQEKGHCLGFQSNVSREFHLQPYTEPTQDKTRALKERFAKLNGSTFVLF